MLHKTSALLTGVWLTLVALHRLVCKLLGAAPMGGGLGWHASLVAGCHAPAPTLAHQMPLHALTDENAVLARALARAQQRCAQQAGEHATHSTALQAELVALRHALQQAGAEIDRLRALADATPAAPVAVADCSAANRQAPALPAEALAEIGRGT